MSQENDLRGRGWLDEVEAESLRLYANRLRQKLHVATHCPECDRELPPRRCQHCDAIACGDGILNEERS